MPRSTQPADLRVELPPPDTTPYLRLALALALSLGAAVSLGITRFAYGLLLPPMRADLGWSYTLAGAMNTANAVGYLVGALATPLLLRRLHPGDLLLWARRTHERLLGYEWLIDIDVLESKALHWPWAKVAEYLPSVNELDMSYNGRRLFVLYNPATERRIGTTHSFFATLSVSSRIEIVLP